jgi:hypothetical protein
MVIACSEDFVEPTINAILKSTTPVPGRQRQNLRIQAELHALAAALGIEDGEDGI